MNKKNVGIAFGALCGLAALTATAAEIFYVYLNQHEITYPYEQTQQLGSKSHEYCRQ